MEERNYSLYIHTNKVNGKKYVGITISKDPTKRWANGKGYKYNSYFNSAIEKYGWENFDHEIRLTDLTHEEAKERERFYIALFRTCDRKFGYNISMGGDSNDQGKDSYSKEYRRKQHHEYYSDPQHAARKKELDQKYRDTHRDEIYSKHKLYNERFKEKYGVTPGMYYYWKKKQKQEGVTN